jgi:hypothetical protein
MLEYTEIDGLLVRLYTPRDGVSSGDIDPSYQVGLAVDFKLFHARHDENVREDRLPAVLWPRPGLGWWFVFFSRDA